MLLFIFDMDDVLYDYDWRVRMDGLTELTGLTIPQLRERWWQDGAEERAEAGGFADADAYLDAFNRALGVSVSEEDWVRVRGSAMTPWPESIAAVERAKQLGRVTLLTNNGPLTAKHLRSLAPELVSVFGDDLYTSSDYGARKPDPEVFTAVLEQYDAKPEDAFFADDLLTNIEGALSVGITAHLFTDAATLLTAIEEFAALRADSGSRSLRAPD
jgi:HAD superfamily hydrolase (TIGR01509 family)